METDRRQELGIGREHIYEEVVKRVQSQAS
jgi:hypothetical protein